MPPTARTLTAPLVGSSVVRAYEAVVDDVQAGERSVVSKINTVAVDRYRTIIKPDGADLEGYRRNPVVLWEHGKDPQRGTMPIGRNQWIKSDSKQIIAKTVFRNDDYSQMLFEAYQDGGLRGWSVNILPSESSPPTQDEMRSAPQLETCQMVYRKWELAEYSGVSVPGNADTLTLIASRGIYVPDGSITRDATVERYITHDGGEYVVHAESGKVLGKHKSKADAEKQLAAIEAHKHDERSAPWVENIGTAWAVYNADGSLAASLPDESMARQCLQLMGGVPSLSEKLTKMLAEVSAARAEAEATSRAYIDLYRYGRV